jgi:hypothetical protein
VFRLTRSSDSGCSSFSTESSVPERRYALSPRSRSEASSVVECLRASTDRYRRMAGGGNGRQRPTSDRICSDLLGFPRSSPHGRAAEMPTAPRLSDGSIRSWHAPCKQGVTGSSPVSGLLRSSEQRPKAFGVCTSESPGAVEPEFATTRVVRARPGDDCASRRDHGDLHWECSEREAAQVDRR